MKSFKGYAYIIATIILTLQIVLILANLFYAKPLYGALVALRGGTHEAGQNIGDMVLPISVLKNVQGQLERIEEIDSKRRERILVAFGENQDALKLELAQTKEVTTRISSILTRIHTYPKWSYQTEFNSVQSKTEEFLKVLDDMDRILASKPTSTIGYQTFQSLRLEALITESVAISDDMLSEINALAVKMTNAYITITLVIFLIMLVSAVILIRLLWRVLVKDIPYLTRALELLNIFTPDLKGLPDITGQYAEEVAFIRLTEAVFKEQQLLNDFKDMGNRHFILDDIIDEMFHMVQDVIPVDRIGVAFVDHERGVIVAEHGISNYGSIVLDTGYTVALSKSSLSEIVRSRKSRLIQDVGFAYGAKPDSESMRMILDEGIQSNMIVPLISGETVFGLIFFSSRETGKMDADMLAFAESLTHELSSIINKTYFAKKMFSTMTRTFADLVDRKDNETGDHIGRMTEYCVAISTKLLHHPDTDYRVKQSFINDLQSDACVHDIGKVAIPDSILKKPGSLTPDEWQVMKTHVVAGHEVLQSFRDQLKIFGKEFYQMATDIVLCHHEKWDGSGYPVGLSAKGIPLSARIVAIADVFDAVTSKRVYKEASGFDEAVGIIRAGSGTHFDPVLVEVFNESLDEFREIHSRGMKRSS